MPAPSGLTPSDSCYVKHLPASYGVSSRGRTDGAGLRAEPEVLLPLKLTGQGSGRASGQTSGHMRASSRLCWIPPTPTHPTPPRPLCAPLLSCRCKRCSSCLRRTARCWT